MNTSAVTTPIKAPRALHLRFDGGLISIVFALLLIGFLFVFSSSWQYASYNDMDSAFLVAKQAAFAAAGLALAFVIYLVDYHRFQRLVVLGVILTLAALIMVLVVHDERNGAARSLFGGSFQPSEVAKLVLILYLAFWLNSKQDVLNQLSLGIVPLIGILGVFMGLIMGQPDISTVATIFAIGVMMFFLGGGEWRQIILVMVLAGLLGALLVSIMSTGQARIAQWLAGLQDPKESSQHVLRSIEAIRGTGFADIYDATGFTASSTNAGSAGTNGSGAAFNEFEGMGGNDTISGDAGDDSIDAGIGTDSVSGGTENDTLLGDLGNRSAAAPRQLDLGIARLHGGDVLVVLAAHIAAVIGENAPLRDGVRVHAVEEEQATDVEVYDGYVVQDANTPGKIVAPSLSVSMPPMMKC